MRYAVCVDYRMHNTTVIYFVVAGMELVNNLFMCCQNLLCNPFIETTWVGQFCQLTEIAHFLFRWLPDGEDMQKALDSMVGNAYLYGRQYIADRVGID